MSPEFGLFWLLLPLAAASGWYLARRNPGVASRAAGNDADRHYHKGLNFLLNEQTDKAIEVFIKMLEVEGETVETHLALGNLFRRRGEVERAILIHQNVIERGNLSQEQRDLAALELGMDYMRSGLLDRAETLFKNLIEADSLPRRALKQLIDIYQMEQDWDSAIATAEQLQARCGEDTRKLTAQLYCEKVEQCLTRGDSTRARSLLAHALTVDPMCVRASLTMGRLAQDAGDYDSALRAYSRIETQDPEYLVEVLPAMLACYQALKREDEFKECLARLAHRRYGTVPTLVLADLMAAQQGRATAIRYLSEQLVQHPSLHGVHRLIQYMLKDEPTSGHRELESLLDITQKMLRDNKAYKCRHCGYASKALQWQCPGCKHWATVKPGHDHPHD